MIVEGGHALELALGLWRVPARVAQARHRPLPDDLQPLLQLAAGDADLAAHYASVTGETPEVLQDAAVFYLQQVLFAPGADHYRVLGVAPDAPEERIKQHYRWLVRWLHPDRNHDELERQYADRVNRAWQELRQPARRAAYDRQQASRARPASDEELWGDAAPAPAAVFSDEPADGIERLSPDSARRLPWMVLGGLAASAALALVLMWVMRPALPPPQAAGQVATELPVLPRPALAEAPASPALPPSAASPPAGPDPAPNDPPLMDTLADAPSQAAPGPEAPGAMPTDAVPPPPPPAPSAPVRAAATAAQAAFAAPPARPAQAPPPPVASPRAAVAPGPRPAATAPAPARPAPPVDRAPATPAPVAAPVPPPVAALPPAAPSEEESRALLAAFSQAYGAGDINALMRLFTRDARNNRGGRDAIVYDYQSLFDASESRALLLKTVAWVAEGERALVLARYEAQVQRTGQRRSQRSRGDIRFELRREGGVPRILQVRHDTD